MAAPTHKLDVMISREQIADRIRDLAAKISSDYDGKPVHVIGVLKGSFVFLADLVRALTIREIQVDFLGVSSYEGTRSSGEVKITHDLSAAMAGKHILLVEDIVDTGLTLSYLLENMQARHPASLKVVSLLDKPARRKVPVSVDYVGFTIEDKFVVGYGLDLDGIFRNLDYVAIYKGQA